MVRRATDISRDCNSMQSRRTNGPSSDAVPSRVSICRQGWHGWFRTQKTDFSCIEYGIERVEPESLRAWFVALSTLATPGAGL